MTAGAPLLPISPESLLRSVLEATGDAVITVDPTGIVLYLNPAAEGFLGYTADEVVGRSAEAIIPSGQVARFREVLDRVIREGSLRDFRTVNRRKDGSAIPLEVFWGAVRGTDETVLGVTAVFRDLTDREATQKALRDSTERYRILFNQGDDAIFVLKPESAGIPGRFVEVNDIACSRYGYTREELLRMTPRELDAPEMSERIPLAMGRLLKEGQALFETLHITKAGRRVPVEVNAIVFEMDGEPAIFSLARDLTRRNEYEEEIERSEERFRSVIDSTPMGIHLYHLNPDGELVFTGANPAADAILATAHRELVGQKIEEAFPGLTGTGVPDRYKEVCRIRQPWHTEQIAYKDQHIQGAFEVFAFCTSKDSLAVMFLDITERRALEQETLDARDSLISQMKAHESYVSEVAHRLRNPLQILVGYLSIFPDSGHLSPEQWVALETLRTAVRRIEEDIKGLTP